MKKYKLEFADRMTVDQIKSLLKEKQAENTSLVENLNYYLGKNPTIQGRSKPADHDGPWNKIPIPRARTLINVATGFMYKPGLIRYEPSDSSENPGSEEFFNEIMRIFQGNSEGEHNSELGKDQGLYGAGFELHYVGEDPDTPQFVRVSPMEIIPVYSLDLKPKLKAAIRFYSMDEKNTAVSILYSDVEQELVLNEKDELRQVNEVTHPYGEVPLVVFENNSELTSDIDPVKALLDAYDLLVSTAMDEEEKFADAFLLLKGGLRMDDESVKKLGYAKVIEALAADQGAEFLTKQGERTSRKILIDHLKQEIHANTFIPDLTDPGALGSKSGESMIYLFALFELLAGVKQAFFDKGIDKRIDLISAALSFPKGTSVGSKADINHVWSRNLPKNILQAAQIAQALNGIVSRETILGQIPFVENPRAEIERLDAEQGMTVPAGVPTNEAL